MIQGTYRTQNHASSMKKALMIPWKISGNIARLRHHVITKTQKIVSAEKHGQNFLYVQNSFGTTEWISLKLKHIIGLFQITHTDFQRGLDEWLFVNYPQLS